jgi:hypothetical protein
MNFDEMVVVSIDDHDVEPADMCERHVPVADSAALKLGHEIRIGTIAWEYDYPHPDSIRNERGGAR